MKSQKKYSTQTFTKRVDHEGGAHVQPKGLQEPTVCKTCGAVYADRRWVAKGTAHPDGHHKHWRPQTQTVCPACVQIAEGIVGGYVAIDGNFLHAHRAEIINLITNEGLRAIEDNPLSRIMTLNDDKGKLKVETTTEHLAQRLGRALEKAFDGVVRYDFSHENKVARVTWHRD